MNPHTLHQMLQALKPVIRCQGKAKRLLERYWSDKIALIWSVANIHCAANECEVALTRKEAIEILQDLHQHHNRQYGLRWSDVTQIITDNVKGRPLTKRELKRFVEQDIVMVQKR